MAPGPLGRGCEACRAQKKKCDLAQPACSRCHKLRIPCVGCGQQRFIFMEAKQPPPPPSPSNATTLLQLAFIAKLHPSHDVRYHIGFRYGIFLSEIPKRLGRNGALDAAVAALLARHTECAMRQDQSDPHAPAVVYYNRGLAALRLTLDDACANSTSDTLCAAMLLAYCQARFDDQFTFFWSPHGLGIAQLIRMRQFTSGRDPFETHLFASLNATLLCQSIANPSIHLTTQEYRKLEKAFLGAAVAAQNIQPWLLMVRISELMAHGRRAITSGLCLDALATAAEEVDASMQLVLSGVRERLRALEVQACGDSFDIRTHASYQRLYGVSLAAYAILLCAWRTLSPGHATLDIAVSGLCYEVLQLTQSAQAYRPLGAVWTVHTIICTWCATQDIDLKAKVENAFLDYQRDAMGHKAKIPINRLRLLERRLSLLE